MSSGYPPMITPTIPMTPANTTLGPRTASGPMMTTGAPTVPAPPPTGPPTPKALWPVKFPSVISGIFASIQGITAIAIIGCEVGSVLIDVYNATIYVGFWAGIFLMMAWISQEATSCCCRDRGCATFALVSQLIGLLFAACVIGFDSYFIVNPSTCFYASSFCNSVAPFRGLYYTESNFNNIKMSLIKGQLGAAALSFVLSLAYIIIYIVTSVQIYRSPMKSDVSPVDPFSQAPLPTGIDGLVLAPPLTHIRPNRNGSPLYYRPTIVVDNGDGRINDLLCPTCSTMMAVSVRKKAAP